MLTVHSNQFVYRLVIITRSWWRHKNARTDAEWRRSSKILNLLAFHSYNDRDSTMIETYHLCVIQMHSSYHFNGIRMLQLTKFAECWLFGVATKWDSLQLTTFHSRYMTHDAKQILQHVLSLAYESSIFIASVHAKLCELFGRRHNHRGTLSGRNVVIAALMLLRNLA